MKFFKLFLLFICVSGFAQSKVGTIDVDFILSKMPELPSVQKQVEEYAKGLDADFEKKMAAYNTLVDTYQQEEAMYTLLQKQEKQKEIVAMEDDLEKFQKNGSQLIVIRQDELLRPLYKKIGTAMETVAEAGKYTQILQMNENVVYIDKNFDLTLAVLNELGITLPEEKK
ncbi:OmpH family outer membrane protein [Altibacter sp.]|uniref:OmpH family outer membrane protein n=1 Tax=Altibacter sp. TaxID=2024823 RepID=UPI000C986B0C|nr:OmpH family outer membrane protein [Altibacter sp.]MAP55230.1 outer membrane chaperone Skp [Altibacter sp.]|tara:strand:+ start:817 stop:1326 length:510 start_codon:yes stop_codon:yes gene_type:complete